VFIFSSEDGYSVYLKWWYLIYESTWHNNPEHHPTIPCFTETTDYDNNPEHRPTIPCFTETTDYEETKIFLQYGCILHPSDTEKNGSIMVQCGPWWSSG
jgi:hypothetical protein